MFHTCFFGLKEKSHFRLVSSGDLSVDEVVISPGGGSTSIDPCSILQLSSPVITL